MEEKLDICPECGGHEFNIDGTGMNVNFNTSESKLMAFADNDQLQEIKIQCNNCNTNFKPTTDGLRKA